MSNKFKFLVGSGLAFLTACGNSSDDTTLAQPDFTTSIASNNALGEITNEVVEETNEEASLEITTLENQSFDPDFIPTRTGDGQFFNFINDYAIPGRSNHVFPIGSTVLLNVNLVTVLDEIEFLTLSELDLDIGGYSEDVRIVRVPIWLSRNHIGTDPSGSSNHNTNFFISTEGYTEEPIQFDPLGRYTITPNNITKIEPLSITVQNSILEKEYNIFRVPARTSVQTAAYIPFTGLGTYYIRFHDNAQNANRNKVIEFILDENNVPSDWQ